MSRKKKAEDFEEDEPGLDISSLIDVCFLLLIYFLVTTTIQPREQDLKMTLPAAAPSDTPPALAPMFIKVDKAGDVYINSGAAEELVESDAASRRLPELTTAWMAMWQPLKQARRNLLFRYGLTVKPSSSVSSTCSTVLAGLEITKVTFTDLIDGP